MKNLSIAAAGAAFIAVGTVAMAPAEAATLTKLDYSGNVTLKSSLVPLFSSELSEIPGVTVTGNKAKKTVSKSFIVDNLKDKLPNAGDSELTIPQSYVLDYFDDAFPGLFSMIPEGTSLTSFAGKGYIRNTKNKIKGSGFNFFYDDNADQFVVNVNNFKRIRSCLFSTCRITGKGDIVASLGVIPVSAKFRFNVLQTATPLTPSTTSASLASASAFKPSVTEVPTSKESATSQVPTSVPEPTVLLGLIGVGGFLAAKRKQVKAG